MVKKWPDWLDDESKRFDNGRILFSGWYPWKKDDKLIPSGLLDPVQIYSTVVIPVQETL